MFEAIKHLKFTQQVLVLAVIIFISCRSHCYSIHSSTTSATIVWLCYRTHVFCIQALVMSTRAYRSAGKKEKQKQLLPSGKRKGQKA